MPQAPIDRHVNIRINHHRKIFHDQRQRKIVLASYKPMSTLTQVHGRLQKSFYTLKYNTLSLCLNLVSDILTVTLENLQRAYTTQKYNLINDEPTHCGCAAINGRKCFSQGECNNRRKKVACPASCGRECMNNA